MKVGDKVKYIGDFMLEQDEIYTISYVRGDFICISDISISDSLPMWESKDFISIKDERKRKLKKIYGKRF